MKIINEKAVKNKYNNNNISIHPIMAAAANNVNIASLMPRRARIVAPVYRHHRGVIMAYGVMA